MYALARPALFALEAERAHRLTLNTLARGAPLAQRLYGARVPSAPVDIMGLRLPNPVGLAAGLDKDGTCIDGLAALGFGFIEIGTVTPVAQSGNAAPRLFRLPEQRAIINRMGFNNAGIETLVKQARAAQYAGVLGINIGKNAKTPPKRAIDDYRAGLRAVYDVASYISINVSSPNTRGLRDLQGRDNLDALLGELVAERDRLADERGRRVPLAVKIAPDLDGGDLDAIAQTLLKHGIDAVIATNTTVARDALPLRWREQAGGLSGAPLRRAATQVIAGLYARLGDDVPIIGVGGIQSARDAVDKLDAGARVLQIYSGLIYRGPGLVRECVQSARVWQSRRRMMAQASIVSGDRAHAATGDRTQHR